MDIKKLENLINRLEITEENKNEIMEMKKLLSEEKYEEMFEILDNLKKRKKIKIKKEYVNNDEYEDNLSEEFIDEEEIINEKKDSIYPEVLQNKKLEETYISLLLANPKAISMYYILYEDNYFESDMLLNIYKTILFTDGEAYASEKAKEGYNFAKEGGNLYNVKLQLKENGELLKDDFEKVYVELLKLFEIRKNYLVNPIKESQNEIIGILNYKLYDQMTIQEVKDAIIQINTTEKFKRSILNNNITNFLIEGENSLTKGLNLPFPLLTKVFKGIRKGETMSYAMPSNSGKSRFTVNLASYLAFIHKKKVLVISNEMSEEKMKLCLITTILNNKEMQKLHNQEICKTEGELLEFKFRPNNKNIAKLDKDGFIEKIDGEKQIDFAKRLKKISDEFNKTMEVTKWIDKQINNSIYFVNITDHTNDELEKVILNYYYKEKIEYVFYDTLKSDTKNIGNGEELKKTATILSNLAQNLNIFIGSSLQLSETSTLPINLNINDLAVSRTVKEVLDILILMKQIHNEDLDKYEYSLEEVDTKFFDLKHFKDPDVRYYSCVVDKNRAGAKPKVLFRLNLAYNVWEELGYLRLK